ncbi:MAG: rhomboid family intramembrane serine protease [Armatimonadota bacterium]
MLFLPIRDEGNRPGAHLLVIKILIAVNVAVFLLEIVLMSTDTLSDFILNFGFIPSRFYYIWTAVTSTFIHGGFFHLAGNMLFLWIFGDNIEDLLGNINFAWFYLLCGFSANFVDMLFRFGSNIPAIGASGAISGLLGAYIRYFPKNKIVTFYFFIFRVGTFKIDALWYLAFWFGGQLFYSLFGSDAMGIAYGAHIGGFIIGYFAAGFFPHNKDVIDHHKEIAKRWR